MHVMSPFASATSPVSLSVMKHNDHTVLLISSQYTVMQNIHLKKMTKLESRAWREDSSTSSKLCLVELSWHCYDCSPF